MKHIISFIIVLCLFVFGLSLNNANANDRHVLVEIFTSTTCPPCVPNNQAFINWYNNYEHKDRVTVIKYPVWWPAPGCFFYHQNPGPAAARTNFYSINAAPSGVVDGSLAAGGASGWINAVQNRINTVSPLSLNISATLDGNNLNVEVTAEHVAGDPIPSGSKLRVALVESDIHYSGPNGMPVHHFTHREMLSGAAGVEVNIGDGAMVSEEMSVEINSNWELANMQLVAFVQNDSGGRPVFQSASYALTDLGVSAPVLVSPADQAEDVALEATLEWEAAAAADSYEVQVSTNASFQQDLLEYNDISGTTVVTDMLEQFTTYYWRVRTEADGTFSGWSDAFTFTTEIVDLNAPELISPPHDAELTNANVLFEWAEITFAEEYLLQVSTQPYFTQTDIILENNVNLNNTEVVLDQNQRYYWRVRGQNDLTDGEWSVNGTFVMNITTSTGPDTELPDQLVLEQNYPNPFNPSTSIRYGVPEQSQVKLEVYTITGQLVTTLVNEMKNPGVHQVTFNSENLSSGTYLYRLQAGETTLTRKMLLIK